jgi:hypothetical protein
MLRRTRTDDKSPGHAQDLHGGVRGVNRAERFFGQEPVNRSPAELVQARGLAEVVIACPHLEETT